MLLVLAGLAAQPAQCDDYNDFIKDTSRIGRSNSGVVMSDQMLELGMVTSNSMRLEGEQCMRLGNIDRAVTVLQKAIELSPGDMDGRILYSIALEKKLLKQPSKKRDPRLYNFCIKQWCYISKKADFEDQKTQAKNHLEKLTGTVPGRFEKAHKFLARTLIAEDGSTKVQIGGQKPESSEKISGKKSAPFD